MNVAILSPVWPDAVAALQAAHRCTVALRPPPEELRRVLADAMPDTFRWLLKHGVPFYGPMPEPPSRPPQGGATSALQPDRPQDRDLMVSYSLHGPAPLAHAGRLS